MNYKIIGKYVKNLIFKIPNSNTFFYLSKEISNYKINIDIKSNQLKEKIIEVEITLSLMPIKENLNKIDTRIVYTTIIEVSNNVTDKTDIEKIILIDVPSKVYSDLRKIFIFVFESSGFKDVKINDKVDFEKLYNMKRTQ
jgi:preprotein translocase subunit SecB